MWGVWPHDEGLISPVLKCFFTCHVCGCECNGLMGVGRRFVLCLNIHFSVCFSALHSSSAGVSFFLHPLTVFPHRYSCSLQHLNPFCPSIWWTCHRKLPTLPPDSLLRTNRFTKVLLMGEKPLWMMKGFLYLCVMCPEMDLSNATVHTRVSHVLLHHICTAPYILIKVFTRSLLPHILLLFSLCRSRWP